MLLHHLLEVSSRMAGGMDLRQSLRHYPPTAELLDLELTYA